MEIVVRVILVALMLVIYLAIAKHLWSRGERRVFVLWIIFGMPISGIFTVVIVLIVLFLLLPIGILLKS